MKQNSGRIVLLKGTLLNVYLVIHLLDTSERQSTVNKHELERFVRHSMTTTHGNNTIELRIENNNKTKQNTVKLIRISGIRDKNIVSEK